MYDWPELRTYTDEFWTLLRQQLYKSGLENLPVKLTRNEPASLWVDTASILTQTCGYPLKHSLSNIVSLVGTPTYTAKHCKEGYYSSVVLAHKRSAKRHISDYRDHIFAANDQHSQSGYNTFRNFLHKKNLLGGKPYFKDVKISGSHRDSIKLVASGNAHICSVDPVSWCFAKRYEPSAKNLTVIGVTGYSPALPLICARDIALSYSARHEQHATGLANIVQQAWRSTIGESPSLSNKLLLRDIVSIPLSEYLAVPKSQGIL